MGLPIGQVGSGGSKDFREKVVGQKEGSHARTDSHASKVTEGAATDATEDVIGKILWRDGLFAGTFQNVNLVVEIVVKVAGHGRWVHSANVDSQGLQLNVQTASQLANKGLGDEKETK